MTAQLVNSALDLTLVLEIFLIAPPVIIALQGLQLNLNANLELSKLLALQPRALLVLLEAIA